MWGHRGKNGPYELFSVPWCNDGDDLGMHRVWVNVQPPPKLIAPSFIVIYPLAIMCVPMFDVATEP